MHHVQRASEVALRGFDDAQNENVVEIGLRSTRTIKGQTTDISAHARPNGFHVMHDCVLHWRKEQCSLCDGRMLTKNGWVWRATDVGTTEK